MAGFKSRLSLKCGLQYAAAMLLACAAGAAQAQAYPSKQIRILVGFAPGGSTDIVARLIAQEMTKNIGQQVNVDNRPGAGSVIAAELTAKAPPDGYTLLACTTGLFAILPFISNKLPYDPEKDLAPVTQTGALPYIIVLHPSLPSKNVKEFIALAKSRPGEINYASSGIGTASHLSGEYFASAAKINMTHVPYKGTGPALTGILSGEVQVLFGGSINTVPQVRSGKLRALAVAGDRRARALPDVPTVAESGFPGYEANSWNGIAAPARTPRAIINRLNSEMLRILALKEVVDYMTADGAEPAGNTPEHFGAYIRSEHAKWAKVIREAKIAAH